MRIVLFAFFLLISFYSCRNKSTSKEKQAETVPSDTIRVIQSDKVSELTSLNRTIMSVLKNKRYDSLSFFIHPAECLRFSPYGYVDTLNDVVLTGLKLIAEMGKKKQDIIRWGEYDGTGDPIKMTLNEYMQRFVYDVDFLNPEKMSINEFLGAGNSQNNILAMYPGCDFTDSHFSGFEEKYDGMDWRSLRLVFKKIDNKYFLIGIVHDEWTI